MNQLEALTTMLDATAEMDDRVHVRRARKVVARMAEKRRLKADERAQLKAALDAWTAVGATIPTTDERVKLP